MLGGRDLCRVTQRAGHGWEGGVSLSRPLCVPLSLVALLACGSVGTGVLLGNGALRAGSCCAHGIDTLLTFCSQGAPGYGEDHVPGGAAGEPGM